MKKEAWKNRIVGEGTRAASEFVLNPLNYRKHPQLQSEVLEAILGEVGWVQRVIVNRTTGNLIDGEARILEALKKGKKTLVPFIEVELTPEEEKKVLAVLDPISALAATDWDKFAELTKEFDFESDSLERLLEEMRGKQVDLDDFFREKESADSDFENANFSIVLEFETKEEYEAIFDALEIIAPTPTEAVKQLLKL